MRSLNAHLAEGGSHGHLPFHPGCPVCRAERLAGRMALEPVISGRAQASLLAAVLALSAGGPATRFATAQVPGDEGSAAPNVGGGEDDDDPTFDPGDELPLPNEVSPPPPAPAGGDDDDGPGGPVEGEPQEPVGSQGGPLAPPPPKPAVGPPAGSVGQPAPAAPPAAPSTPVAPPARPRAPAGETRERAKQDRNQRAKQGVEKQAQAFKRAVPRSPAPHGAAVTLEATPARAASAPVAAQPAGATAAGAGTPATSGRAHVVQRGESLWSIASDQLGHGASPARIAHQVNRLWELNERRIATGDPDMLMVGTKLELPSPLRG